MSQLQDIKKHLVSGKTLTGLEALKLFGCYRLSARIQNLRDEGLNIKTIMVEDGKKRYAKYVIPYVSRV